MIGSLRGRLIDRSGDGVVLLEVAGVGYQVTMTVHGASRLSTGSDETFLWIHHHVREDAEILFGFVTREERSTFEILLGTHGVGPAMALAILGSLGADELVRAVVTEDAAALCRVPGVGKKTAARLLVELANRLDVDPAGIGSSSEDVVEVTESSGVLAEVHAGLTGLGYGPDEIAVAVRGLDPEMAASEALKAALRQLTGAKR